MFFFCFCFSEAFEPLKHLSHVDLFNNPLLMHNAEQAALHLPSHQLQIGLGANRLFQGLPNSLISNASASIVALNLSGNLLFLLTNALFSSLQMPMLATLILESCSVSLVEPGAFRSLPNLTSLYLGKNQLNAIAANALPPSLTLLSLNRNPQRSGDPFKMTDDNLAHLKRLHWLDISYMNIEDMTPNVLNGLGNLLVLQIRGSGLTNIPGGLFSSLSNLLVLDLGENALHTLPNEFSTGLERTRMLFLDRCELDFSSNGEENATTHNDTEELYQPFREMKALELLYLHSNNIRHFSASLVANLTNLRVLYLRGNLLQTWESGTTAFMPREAAIDASNNRITILPNYTFEEFDRISAVDLSDNALTCNCEVSRLRRRIESTHSMTTLSRCRLTTLNDWPARRATRLFATGTSLSPTRARTRSLEKRPSLRRYRRWTSPSSIATSSHRLSVTRSGPWPDWWCCYSLWRASVITSE